MRKILCILVAMVLVVTMALGVSAAIGAPKVGSFNTVSRDGSCQVTTTVTIHIDEVRNDLMFPVPKEASSVAVNGSRVRTTQSGDVRVIDLDKILGKAVGDFSLSINYTLPDVIHTTATEALELRIPLLSGFNYPIAAMEFSVSLPGIVDTLPAFESGYHQANIERDILYTVEGATVSGFFTKELKDHETLTMKLLVSQEMFPQTLANTQDYGFGLVAMGICAALAVLYWLLTMGAWPFHRERSTEPPYGFTAGEMGCVLNLRGADLHLTVLSWAQLGYITVKVAKGRVLLQKRMDMGNERKEEEQKLFQKLFYKRDTVDTASYPYALLCRKTAAKPMGIRELIHRRSGNPTVFRVLASGIGLFGGVSLAIALSNGALLQGFLIVVLAVLGGLSGWYIQSVGWRFSAMRQIWPPLALGAGWLVLGILSDAFLVALWMVLGLLAAGLLLAWGGRRTATGKEMTAQVQGLRRYMRTAKKLLVQRLCNADPEYFFTMAPYAMALGVGKAFARRFEGMRLSGCPYLVGSEEVKMTAEEWMERLKVLVKLMDDRAKKLPFEKLLGFFQSVRR